LEVWDHLDTMTPNTFPAWLGDWFYDLKISMYFTYSTAQNYVRVLTQGVRLTDNRNMAGNYRRVATETARIDSGLSRFQTFYCKCIETVRNTMTISRLNMISRTFTEKIQTVMRVFGSRDITRKFADKAGAVFVLSRALSQFRSIQDGIWGNDHHAFSVLYIRSVADNAATYHVWKHEGAFIKEVTETAGSNAETERKLDYKRFESDTVQAEGKAKRGLLLFVKIVTQVFIRDYLLRRFLVGREELVLKSCITRDMVLDSKIN